MSVCLSITRRYCVKMNEVRAMPSSLMGSLLIPVFGNVRFINIFARNHPSGRSQRRLFYQEVAYAFPIGTKFDDLE